MELGALLAVFRIPQAYAQWLLLRDIAPFLRVHFLYFAIDSGLLRALGTPLRRDELVSVLGVTRPELLDPVLELGVALKELSARDGRYRLRGRRSRALAAADGDQLAAMIEEFATYHASVYRELTGRLRGAPLGDYLDEYATVIARSSRLLEPFLASFVRGLVRGRGALRLLEIGCGSGVYLRHAAEANPDVTGVAVEIQPAVAEQALASLAAWGVGERFTVVAGDIREPPAEVAGPFHLITLHQNVYYFQPEERPALFERLRSWLAPGGRLVVTSLVRGKTLASLDLDLALRCTKGNTALPALDELASQLREGGFTRVEHKRLMPLEPLYGVIATGA